jgi:hypothetical protein
MALEYTYATRSYRWIYGAWQSYTAGYAFSWAPGVQSFNVYPGHAIRGAFQISGGDWNYVRVSTALGLSTDGAWCYYL